MVLSQTPDPMCVADLGANAVRRAKTAVIPGESGEFKMIYINKKSYPYSEEVNEGILREFRRLLPLTGRVLDVGCGRAALSEAIQRLGWEAWGIEQNGEACAAAQGRTQRLIRADLLDINRVEAALGQCALMAWSSRMSSNTCTTRWGCWDST